MIIRNLIAALREDETVYVNDMGLFRRVFTRAHIEGNRAVPPRYSVTLNSEEEGSGYGFILFVSKSENIRIMDADLAIRRWVEKLFEELHNSRSVNVEGFGTFSLKKSKLEFTAAPEIPELNVEFEGLEPIDIQKYPKQKHPERVEVMPAFEPASEMESEPVVEPAPVIEPEPVVEPAPVIESEPVVEPAPVIEPEPVVEPAPVIESEPVVEPAPVIEPEPVVEPAPVTEPEPEIETEPKKHWGWIVFVVALLLAIGVLGWLFQDNLLDFYHQKFDKQTVADTVTVVEDVPEPAVADTVAEADTIGFVEEELEMEELASEAKPFDINNPEHIQYEKGKYYLVHGSFSQESDCARHIRSHHFETYSPTVLHQSGNSRLRVCLGVFSSEAEATQFATSNGIKDAWTLK